MSQKNFSRVAPNALAFFALLLGGAAIGFAPIFVRWADTGPVASAFWRLALAAPVLWFSLWARSASHVSPRVPVSLQRAAVLAGLFFAGDLGVWHWSIMFTSVSNATLLANIAPIFVTLGGWLLFRQRVSQQFIAAMTIVLGGAALLVGPNFTHVGLPLIGDGLGALAAVSYAGYLLAIKQERERSSAVAVMALSTTVGALALLPIALFSPQPMLPAGEQGWVVLIGMAVVTQLLGQGLIVYAFAHLPATLSSVSLLIQPVVATMLAWILFGETLSLPQWIGGVFVLGGIFAARRFTK